MKKKKLKSKRVADWFDVYQAVIEMVPEFAFTSFNQHRNTEFEQKARNLNEWKKQKCQEIVDKYNSMQKVSDMELFILKLELAKKEYDWDNMGKKTMAEALEYIKNK